MAPFSMIVLGVVVWTIAVSGAKQLRFRLKTDLCGRGLKHKTGVFVTDQSVDGRLRIIRRNKAALIHVVFSK